MSAPDPPPHAADPFLRIVDALSAEDARIVSAVAPHTMTNPERVVALLNAVVYVERRQIPGAYVECGVWRGGSALAIVLKLLALGVSDRELHIYDTFTGMTKPTEHDTSPYGAPALQEWCRAEADGDPAWPEFFAADKFSADGVRDLLAGTGYPTEHIHLVVGPVEHTIPAEAPEQIALLRLDTDWYQSTRHELVHLYPRLSPTGVLIIDDYGHWAGCRQAVDEYFSLGEHQPPLLSPVDYTCRVGVKT